MLLAVIFTWILELMIYSCIITHISSWAQMLTSEGFKILPEANLNRQIVVVHEGESILENKKI